MLHYVTMPCIALCAEVIWRTLQVKVINFALFLVRIVRSLCYSFLTLVCFPLCCANIHMEARLWLCCAADSQTYSMTVILFKKTLAYSASVCLVTCSNDYFYNLMQTVLLSILPNWFGKKCSFVWAEINSVSYEASLLCMLVLLF